MHHKIIIKISALICALVALNTALNAFGYGIILQMWAAYVALVASGIVILAYGMMLVMHGGHGCAMWCHSEKGQCICGKENCNCK